MKLYARVLGIVAVCLIFIMLFLDVSSENIKLNELTQITGLAVEQTQQVMREQIKAELNEEEIEKKINSNDEYIAYFQKLVSKLITNEGTFSIDVYNVDYTKGLLDVGLTCKYNSIFAKNKAVHTRKTSIIDILKINKY